MSKMTNVESQMTKGNDKVTKHERTTGMHEFVTRHSDFVISTPAASITCNSPIRSAPVMPVMV